MYFMKKNNKKLYNTKYRVIPVQKQDHVWNTVNFCVTVLWQWFLLTSSLSFVMADIKEKDLTILQACNGMITSDNKPVMSVAQKSIVFIYLLQCSQAVWVSVQERLAEHVPEKEKGNRECGFLWKRDKHIRFRDLSPHGGALRELEARVT